MARGVSRSAARLITTLFFLFVCVVNGNAKEIPQISSLSLLNVTETAEYNVVVFEIRGSNIAPGSAVRITKDSAPRDSVCVEDLTRNAFNASEQWNNGTVAVYRTYLPRGECGEFYLCLPREENLDSGEGLPPNVFPRMVRTWYHRGSDFSFKVNVSGTCSKQKAEESDFEGQHLSKRQEVAKNTIRVTGLRLEVTSKDPDFDENGVPDVLANHNQTLRLFGYGFNKDMLVTFTHEYGEYGGSCLLPATNIFSVTEEDLLPETVRVVVSFPLMKSDSEAFFICVKEGGLRATHTVFVHQGNEHWIRMKSYGKMVPVWAAIVIVCVCLSFSALFSGLNLGLMSLDRTELKILCNTGTSQERKYAKIIQPVRNHGNYLLCSILLGNVFVNSIFTILLDDLTSGLIAVIFSTIAIVLFGEITPQAVCSRHGLAIGAKTIGITKVVMVLTFPLAYPISKMLDFVLGEEIGNVYNRERLKELVKVTTGENDLDRDEVNIISGALELRKKTVADVMTRIEDVFMLDYEAILDFETVSEIMKSGYSRIPVYEGTRQNIVTMLYIKDLAFVDPDDNTPLKTLCQFYQNPCNFVFEDVTLDVMFKIFKEGNKGHMAFVHRVNNEGEGDPFYETIGLITLEDVIEELIQAEIMDETDVFTDNRSKRKRNAESRARQDFTVFAERRTEGNRMHISPQLTLATYQYLSTSVEAFHKHTISETILLRLLKQDIFFHIKKNKEWRTDASTIIYQRGKPVDFFVLILEGRVEVTVGQENLVFESGPFTYFGTQALVQNIGCAESPVAPSALGSLESLNMDSTMRHTFHPDYSVRACTEVLYLRVKRSLYLAAKRATLMERAKKDNNTDQFDAEVDKLLHSVEDEESSPQHRTPRKSSAKNLQLPESKQQQLQQSKHSTSPKNPSLYSNVSPPHRMSDANGSIRSGQLDDAVAYDKEEEVSLLTRS